MRKSFVSRFFCSRKWLSVVSQGSFESSDSPVVQEFYSSFTYADEFSEVNVPYMNTELLPFQKEGVSWMAHRELNHVGGLMADHLGMGKTIQMIGLCLISEGISKLLKTEVNPRKKIISEGARLITVLQQLNSFSVVANCSKINQPARGLKELLAEVDVVMKGKSDSLESCREEVLKWLKFASKFHPAYEKRALAFLADEEKRTFDMIESKELRTLVVVPASLLYQWRSEIEKKVSSDRKISVYLFHGDNKWISCTELETFDFVITTYDTLTHSASSAFIPGDDGRTYGFSRKEAGPLFQINWKRIILDEAHMIKNVKTARWRSIQELKGIHRWAVTATPVHNSLEDLQNLLQFVGLPKLPLLSSVKSEEILKDPVMKLNIARALQPAFLRRGPVMMRNGKKEVLVNLPAKSEEVVKGIFTLKESQMYNNVLAKSRSALVSSENKDATFHIFAMMTRLRQACCHPWISQEKAVKIVVCGICNSEAVAAVTGKCGHSFCHECLLVRFRDAVDGDNIASKIPCPTCSFSISYNSVFKKQMLTSAERIALFKENEFVLSTKLKMILQTLNEIRRKHPNDKAIIFSQFTSFMDVISVALDRYHIEHLRLDGTMTLTHRSAVIRSFETNDNIKVVLASKTATGVGLNLTVANHVLMVDPWWNPAIEEQAVHRCYRIGQKKPVYVSRFIISDTIEQYCYEISQKKKEFGDAILKAATSKDSNVKMAASRLMQLVSRLSFVEGKDTVDTEKAVSSKQKTQTTKLKEKKKSQDIPNNDAAFIV